MRDNLSNQFPKPPKLQPLSSQHIKVWQIVSWLLIVSGIVLLVTGGCRFYQQQFEASKPPPARILEVSLIDLTKTPPPSPRPTKIRRTNSSQSATDTPVVEPTSTSTRIPTATFELVATLAAISTSTATSIPTTRPTPEATATTTATPTPANEPTPRPVTQAPSLADNPLVVQEVESASGDAGTGSAEGAGSPPTHIVAESIGLDADIVEVGWEQVVRDGVATNVWIVADYAAGWHRNSMTPGQGGNIVLSGHHNIKGEVFRYIVDIEINETITLYVGDQPYKYVVQDKFIVKDKGEPEAIRRENAKWIGPFNEERLTLVTCWPYNNNTHRVIVIAKPAEIN